MVHPPTMYTNDKRDVQKDHNDGPSVDMSPYMKMSKLRTTR